VPSVTADTNIYISGFKFGGLPRRFLDLAADNAFRLDISDAILNEILRVLREKFRWSTEKLQEIEDDIWSYTQRVVPTQTVNIIKADPSDNRILECAVAAKSDFIVSGDSHHLLPVGNFGGIRIVRVADFLELL
jgi:uncharacterized protein